MWLAIPAFLLIVPLLGLPIAETGIPVFGYGFMMFVGFSTATLLAAKRVTTVGLPASFTLPERLKWPRNVDAFEDVSDEARGRPGATLVLRVDGPRAIEVQYQTVQIIERINAHFGYRAVSDIRFIQAPLDKRTRETDPRAAEIADQRRRMTAVQSARLTATKSQSPDASTAPDGLLAALDRLHANMTRARSD